jgi:hypothetical protein
VPVVSSLGCTDESGAAVDWWFLSKHPGGASYSLVSSTSGDWSASSKQVTDTSSVLGKQMSGIYDGSVKNYVFYNDQTPDGQYTLDYGHSKGFFAYDDSSAFWVQHSIPDFPNYVKDGYRYGSGQEKYGQHAFCLTLSPDNLDQVAGAMKYANPQVFDYNVDGKLAQVQDVVDGKKTASGSTA